MISKDTIWTDSWNQVYSTIDTNVSDPRNRNKKWKYSAFPDVTAGDFSGFPIIIINPPSIGRDTITVGTTPLKNYDLDIRIEVYDTSAKRLKTIADLTLQSLESNRESFRTNGMQNFSIGSSTYDILRIESFKKVHYLSIPCSFTHKEV